MIKPLMVSITLLCTGCSTLQDVTDYTGYINRASECTIHKPVMLSVKDILTPQSLKQVTGQNIVNWCRCENNRPTGFEVERFCENGE